MWAFGRLDLGLSDAEFWDLTIEEFTALSDRQHQRERTLNYRAGLAAAAIYNVNRSSKTQEPIHALDFFGRGRDEPIGMTDTQIRNECDAMLVRACALRGGRKRG